MSNNQILKNTNAKILDQFNASVMFDKELYAQDIKGSIAHSKMLALQGIITIEDQEKIENGFLQVKDEIESGRFQWKIEDEDVHMAIESKLTELIGDAGGRLHTARSRNDQVATDFTLYVQDKTLAVKDSKNEPKMYSQEEMQEIMQMMMDFCMCYIVERIHLVCDCTFKKILT